MVTHQTHLNDEKGQTDSSHKLSRLKMPGDLSGKRVLDIGCNEGFFCNQALQRNAASVTGIDMDERFLSEARRRYKDERLTYIQQGWDQLPEGPFDLILWTSAMHYELDPEKILTGIRDILSPDGMLILECGVQMVARKEMVYSLRHDGGLWYPTLPLIEAMLTRAGLSFRMVSHAELVGTDPIPRVVFHCKRKTTTVMLVSGQTGSGKTNLSGQLYGSATKVIALDFFVARISKAKWVHTPLEKLIKEKTDPASLGGIYNAIDAEGLTEEYVRLVCKGIVPTDELVVIEGYMTDKQRKAFQDQLRNRAFLWDVQRP